jgi:hypothetical protein
MRMPADRTEVQRQTPHRSCRPIASTRTDEHRSAGPAPGGTIGHGDDHAHAPTRSSAYAESRI